MVLFSALTPALTVQVLPPLREPLFHLSSGVCAERSHPSCSRAHPMKDFRHQTDVVVWVWCKWQSFSPAVCVAMGCAHPLRHP